MEFYLIRTLNVYYTCRFRRVTRINFFVFLTYITRIFFDVNDRKNDPKVVRKLNVHYTCNLERIQFHLFKRY